MWRSVVAFHRGFLPTGAKNPKVIAVNDRVSLLTTGAPELVVQGVTARAALNELAVDVDSRSRVVGATGPLSQFVHARFSGSYGARQFRVAGEVFVPQRRGCERWRRLHSRPTLTAR